MKPEQEVTFNGCIKVRVKLIEITKEVVLSERTYKVWSFEVLDEIPKGYRLPTFATETAFTI